MDRKRLFPILLIIFTNILGAGVIIPVLPLYAQGEFNGSVIQITLLFSSFFGAQFFAAPWLGKLSDRHGRRPILIASQIGTVFAFILFIFAGKIGGQIDNLGMSLPLSGGMIMLFVARILDGITGGNKTTAQAYIIDITPDNKRAEGLGLLQAAYGAGFIFGPAFGGILGNFGLMVPFIGATIITTITLLLTIFTLKESLPKEERALSSEEAKTDNGFTWRKMIKERSLVLILSIGFIGSVAFAALPATYALFSNDVLLADVVHPNRIQLYIGIMLAFNGLVQVITQIAWLRPLVQRFGEKKLLALGIISIFIALFGLSNSTNAIIGTLFLAPWAFGYGVTEPNTQSLITRFRKKSLRGYLLGIYQSARNLGLIIGPIWAGIVYAKVSPQAVYAVGAAIMLIAFVGALFVQRMSFEAIKVEA
jgi:DHA1 family tetracycline resistance protein-like MFS transporter